MIPAGTVIEDRYKIEKLIGQGGMQDVYLAKDRLVEREVALKTPQAGQKIKRFRQSAIIAARINHHNVAKTYDYIDSDDRPVLIEELVAGPTLEDAIARSVKYLDPHLGAKILFALAKGVAASHKAGVVHRDLKPSNVLVTGGFNLDALKITDFGIATLTEAVFEEAQKTNDLTRSTSKTIQGAFPYMAPEMMFRKVGEYPGSEVDIWAIGAMVFRLLAGEYAFGEGFEAAANIKLRQRTPWPDLMSLKAQFSPLALELQILVEACLQFDPASRPTAEQLVQRCEELCFLSNERFTGTVVRRFNQTQGVIVSDHKGEEVFFHQDSVYGTYKISTGDRVCFCTHPGSPLPRAHPVTLLR